MPELETVQPPAWLHDGEVLVHVGVPKTGSTSVQGAMAAAREKMLAQGVLYPGTGTNHYEAAMAVVGKRRGWDTGGWVPAEHRWTELMEQVSAASSGKVVLSGEVLCEARAASVERIVGDIGRGRARIVITLRPIEQLLPSTWQQYIKAGSFFTFDSWLRDVLRGPSMQGQSQTPSFWKRNNHGALVERWAGVAGAENVAVVVIDRSHPRGIYDAFEDIIGLGRGMLDPSSDSNRSLSANEVEMVRRVNEAISKSVEYRIYNQVVRRGGFTGLVEGRSIGEDEEQLFVPDWAAEQARAFGRKAAMRIRDAGVTVYGDLDDLVPDTPLDGRPLPAPQAVPIEAPALMMTAMLERVVNEIEREHQKQQRLKSALDAERKKLPARVSNKLQRETAKLRERIAGGRR